VPRRVELEQAAAHIKRLQFGQQAPGGAVVAQVDADTRQHAGQLLHVVLRIAAAHAQCVQFHQLARDSSR
jgi:hypothetical protein